jgi:hypothetical protein
MGESSPSTSCSFNSWFSSPFSNIALLGLNGDLGPSKDQENEKGKEVMDLGAKP